MRKYRTFPEGAAIGSMIPKSAFLTDAMDTAAA